MLSDAPFLCRLVVIRPDDKLGETLLATPVYRALREALPDAQIEAWVGQRWRSVLAAVKHVNLVQGVPYRPQGLAYLRLVQRLRRIRPDAVLILRPDTRRYAALARSARVPMRVGMVQLRQSCARLLTHVATPPTNAHQVEWNLAVAEALLNRSLPRYPLEYAPTTEASLPAPLQGISPRSYAVLHLSTGGVQPQWLPERFAQVSDWLAEQQRLTPVWSAAPADAPFAQQVALCAQRPAVNLAGKLSIHQLAEVLRGARLLISVDTGVVHLAAAVGTPCVSLHFRMDYPHHRWHAWQVPNRAVAPDTHCAECSPTRCRLLSRECVRAIATQRVIEAARALLEPQS
ncbi:MAG: glycosyltransferase family 9 protein [Fimbriimonadales bacterium]|nr:glycosyltransferase family 9 protein [Fimbriimonadales bacterium]